jgi:hypothetical protein
MASATSTMIEIHVEGDLYIVTAPKLRLALTKAQFVAALKRAKAMQRQAALATRLAQAEEARCQHSG